MASAIPVESVVEIMPSINLFDPSNDERDWRSSHIKTQARRTSMI